MTRDAKTDARRSLLAACEAELARARAALPQGASVEGLLSHVRAALARRPDLASCTPASVVRAAVEAALIGLPVETGGLAHLVPHRDRNGVRHAQLIVGYRGYLALMREHPDVVNVGAQVVRERDYVQIELGDHPSIVHKPAIIDRGDAVGAYAYLETTRGSRLVEWMTIDEIRSIADRARRRQVSSPWDTDFEEMARKTVLRRLAKWAPTYDRLLRALAVDEVPIEDMPAATSASTPARRIVRSSAEALAIASAPVDDPAPAPPPEPEPEPAPPPEVEDTPPADPQPKREKRLARVVTADGEVWATVASPEAWLDAYRQLRESAATAEERATIARANRTVLARVAERIEAARPLLAEAEAADDTEAARD